HSLGHDLAVPRLVSRPPYRVRVRRQPFGREAGRADLQRWQRRLRLGRRVGGCDPGGFTGLERRVPDSTVTAPLRAATEPHVRPDGRPGPVPLRPAGELAAVPAVEG